jgi:hypothetical protein
MRVQSVSVGGGLACEFLGWHRAVNLRHDPAHATPVSERACDPSLRHARTTLRDYAGYNAA